jgi:hypothetical protein
MTRLKAPGIHMDTARRFKGMEASVVIVTETRMMMPAYPNKNDI